MIPSYHYTAYGDDDLANLIAYLKQVPPAENGLTERQIQFPGTIFLEYLLSHLGRSIKLITPTSAGKTHLQ
ncbi:MAG: hypothetical protein AAF485_28815 [Chloroflexota bacterium]